MILIANIIKVLIVIMLIIYILLRIFYSKFRGSMGEYWVKKELEQFPKEEYIVFNDIMIEDDKGSHQIDHIVVSKFGIFVIEMKNYYGMILGDNYKDKWIQYLGKNKYYFKNPIHQNYGHISALKDLLNLEESVFISIVCFSNDAKLKIKGQNHVVRLNSLLSLIKSFDIILLNFDIAQISDVITKNNIIDKEKRKNHVKQIRNKIKDDNFKVNNMICPKCGYELILKNGKYGNFIGCSNYPKCKYMKKR